MKQRYSSTSGTGTGKPIFHAPSPTSVIPFVDVLSDTFDNLTGPSHPNVMDQFAGAVVTYAIRPNPFLWKLCGDTMVEEIDRSKAMVDVRKRLGNADPEQFIPNFVQFGFAIIYYCLLNAALEVPVQGRFFNKAIFKDMLENFGAGVDFLPCHKELIDFIMFSGVDITLPYGKGRLQYVIHPDYSAIRLFLKDNSIDKDGRMLKWISSGFKDKYMRRVGGAFNDLGLAVIHQFEDLDGFDGVPVNFGRECIIESNTKVGFKRLHGAKYHNSDTAFAAIHCLQVVSFDEDWPIPGDDTYTTPRFMDNGSIFFWNGNPLVTHTEVEVSPDGTKIEKTVVGLLSTWTRFKGGKGELNNFHTSTIRHCAEYVFGVTFERASGIPGTNKDPDDLDKGNRGPVGFNPPQVQVSLPHDTATQASPGSLDRAGNQTRRNIETLEDVPIESLSSESTTQTLNVIPPEAFKDKSLFDKAADIAFTGLKYGVSLAAIAWVNSRIFRGVQFRMEDIDSKLARLDKRARTAFKNKVSTIVNNVNVNSSQMSSVRAG